MAMTSARSMVNSAPACYGRSTDTGVGMGWLWWLYLGLSVGFLLGWVARVMLSED